MVATTRLRGLPPARPLLQPILPSRVPDWVPSTQLKLAEAIERNYELMGHVLIRASMLWDGTRNQRTLIVECGSKRLEKIFMPAWSFVEKTNLATLKDLLSMSESDFTRFIAESTDRRVTAAFFVDLLKEVAPLLDSLVSAYGHDSQLLAEALDQPLRRQNPFRILSYDLLVHRRPKLKHLAMDARDEVGLDSVFADDNDFTEMTGEMVGSRRVYCANPGLMKQMYLNAMGNQQIDLKLPSGLGEAPGLLIRANRGERLRPAEKEFLAQTLVRVALEIIAVSSDVVGGQA